MSIEINCYTMSKKYLKIKIDNNRFKQMYIILLTDFGEEKTKYKLILNYLDLQLVKVCFSGK